MYFNNLKRLPESDEEMELFMNMKYKPAIEIAQEGN